MSCFLLKLYTDACFEEFSVNFWTLIRKSFILISERKADEFKGSKKGGKDDTEKKRQVNEKKSGKLQNWKEKEGEKEEKEKVVRKVHLLW